MAMHVPFETNTYTVPDELLPGNSLDPNPVEFDLEPAWGPDLARLKSVAYGTLGITQTQQWTPEVQEAVIGAFQVGAPGFANTVKGVRGLTVDARMALRGGLIAELPTTVVDGRTVPDLKAKFVITNGFQFSKICTGMIAMSMLVAAEIIKLSEAAEKAMDPRFFPQPSGSGGTGTPGKTPAGTAKTARRRTKKRGTVASDSGTAG